MLSHTLHGETLVVTLTGDLDHHTAADTAPQLDRLILHSGALHLILDLSDVTFMDSSGIGVILGRYRRLHRMGGRVTLRRPTPAVDRMLALSGIESIIPVRRDRLDP